VDLVNCDVKASASVVDGPAAVGAATGCAVHADGEQHSLCPGFERDLPDASGWILPKRYDERRVTPMLMGHRLIPERGRWSLVTPVMRWQLDA
jgi:hypothetical protein